MKQAGARRVGCAERRLRAAGVLHEACLSFVSRGARERERG